jgi:hypothetical protein
VFRVQQNLWKLEVGLAGLTAATIVTDAGLGWLESSLRKSLENRQIDTSANGGALFERVVGAAATDYEAIDHVITEPDGRKTVVSLGSRGDTHNMTDDEYLRRTEKTLIEKAQRISTQRIFEHRTDVAKNIPPNQVAGRMVAVAVPETRAHLMNDARMTAVLTRVHQTVSNVRSTTMLLRGWRPGR